MNTSYLCVRDVFVTSPTFGEGTVFTAIVCLSVCLSVNTVTQKDWVGFHEIEGIDTMWTSTWLWLERFQ